MTEEEKIVQFSLEGKCVECGGNLPKHLLNCPVITHQLELEFEIYPGFHVTEVVQ
tara:strand:+ start:99 stop:263 length:165 start_codon:yes stop_codon:yes gene_type:complete